MPRRRAKPKRQTKRSRRLSDFGPIDPIDPIDLIYFFAGMMGATVRAAYYEPTTIDPATRAQTDAVFAKLKIPVETN